LTTISLPLAIWGTGYAEFLPRWWEGVLSLEVQPDEVVIVADAKNHLDVMASLPDVDFPIITEPFQGEDYADFWNRAIGLSSSDWVAICNADDKFLPGALNEIQAADQQGCNLLCDSIQDKDSSSVTRSHWPHERIGTEWTMVGAEPMKKSLWEAAGGFRKGYLFADWQLAMDMAKTGLVKAYEASTLRIIFDRGYTRKTLSGVMQDGMAKADGYKMLRELAAELEL
jgi:hypothetical protein